MTNDELDEWRRWVGAALLSFGEIELITVECVNYVPVVRDKRRSFSERVDLLVKTIAERRTKLEPAAAEFVEMLEEAKRPSETRNTIAHNPLQLVFYDELAAEHGISNAQRPGKLVDLARLKEFAARAEDLAAALFLARSKLQSRELFGEP